MAEITASLVKELRERTGAGMMDCKKALTEANGDIELAIENMRKSGAIKAAKKAGNVAADGVIKTKIEGNYGYILEVNCQTDFVAKDGGFQAFADKVLDAAVAGKISDVEVLKAHTLRLGECRSGTENGKNGTRGNDRLHTVSKNYDINVSH